MAMTARVRHDSGAGWRSPTVTSDAWSALLFASKLLHWGASGLAA